MNARSRMSKVSRSVDNSAAKANAPQVSPQSHSLQRKPLERGAGLTAAHVMQLQRAYGNQAMMQMLRAHQGVQAQSIQRVEEDEYEEENEELQLKEASGPAAAAIQRVEEDEYEDEN
ncbi:hypothetical protein, partial [Paenibacillus koleovorans]|uniref:hypothetical protein n=1 Tax=Paenibacillus koleovorans TaxID=121608 RepID=UPI0013E289FE